MNRSICILGRQPELGLAELESLYGADKVRRVGEDAALIEVDPCVLAFPRLGGSIKLAKVLTILDTSNWGELEKFGIETIPEHVQHVPEGKFKLGLSAHGFKVTPKRINATVLSFKKAVKIATRRNVRVIPNNGHQLSSAQVLHNQLTSPTGWELLFIADGKQTIVAQTIVVQDIESYAARDQARPKRDARVGMLPPKLAQIIINLAAGTLPMPKNQSEQDGVCLAPELGAGGKTILDPFCGTGVILQEALLMGYKALGSDLEPRMVAFSQENLEWLTTHMNEANFELSTADATQAKWDTPFNLLATETYLGRAFSVQPKPEVLEEVIQDTNVIHKRFLHNLALQTKTGFRMCIAVPAWSTTLRSGRPHGSDSNEKTKSGFKHLKVLDHLEEIGYTRVSFVHGSLDRLVYHRPGQIVARELVVLIRK